MTEVVDQKEVSNGCKLYKKGKHSAVRVTRSCVMRLMVQNIGIRQVWGSLQSELEFCVAVSLGHVGIEDRKTPPIWLGQRCGWEFGRAFCNPRGCW